MNKYIQSGKDNPAPEYYDLMLRKKLKMEKCFETTIFVKTANNDRVPMGTQWGLTEKESVNKAMFEFDTLSNNSEASDGFGAEDVVAIETTEISVRNTPSSLKIMED